MGNLDATSQAKKDADQVTNLDHTKEGPESAYHQLITDYNNYQRSGASQADVKQYWSSITSDLAKSGVLPDVSIAWANNQLTGKNGGETAVGHAIDTTGDQVFTQQELSKFAKDSSASNNPTDQANATFAKSLGGELPNIPENGVPAIFNPGEAVTASDLQSKENSIITANEQATARQAQAPLFANNGALLKSLDSAANPGGPLDGNVGNNDLNAWLSAYKLATENGTLAQPADSPFTKANAQFVQDILKGNYNGQGDGLNSAGFQVNQLGQAGGYGWDNNFSGTKNNGQEYTDLVNAYNKAGGDPGTSDTGSGDTSTGTPSDTSSSTHKAAPGGGGGGNPTDTGSSIATDVEKGYIQNATVQSGGNIWDVAAGLLGPNASATAISHLDLALLKLNNGNSVVDAGQQILTAQNFQQALAADPDLQTEYEQAVSNANKVAHMPA